MYSRVQGTGDPGRETEAEGQGALAASGSIYTETPFLSVTPVRRGLQGSPGPRSPLRARMPAWLSLLLVPA